MNNDNYPRRPEPGDPGKARKREGFMEGFSGLAASLAKLAILRDGMPVFYELNGMSKEFELVINYRAGIFFSTAEQEFSVVIDCPEQASYTIFSVDRNGWVSSYNDKVRRPTLTKDEIRITADGTIDYVIQGVDPENAASQAQLKASNFIDEIARCGIKGVKVTPRENGPPRK